MMDTVHPSLHSSMPKYWIWHLKMYIYIINKNLAKMWINWNSDYQSQEITGFSVDRRSQKLKKLSKPTVKLCFTDFQGLENVP